MEKFLAIGDSDVENAVIRWRQPLGRPECPYSYRWSISLHKFGSIRLHRWLRSDDMRAKHDHSQDFITLVLKGGYQDLSHHACKNVQCFTVDGFHYCDTCGQSLHAEDDTTVVEQMRPGMVRRRRAEHRHTVEVDPGGCWTLLYFSPPRRKWGFWVPRKLDGKMKFMKSNKYFLTHGHHPCDQP